MSTRKEEKRLVVVKTSGVLPELGYITGPVLMPWYVPMSKLVQLINNGRDVWEVNPEKRDERVKLTIKNLKTSNFGNTVNGTTTQETSKKEEELKKAVETSQVHSTTAPAEAPAKEEVKAEEPAKEATKEAKNTAGDFTKKK